MIRQFENLKIVVLSTLLFLFLNCRKAETVSEVVDAQVHETHKSDSIIKPTVVVKECDTDFDVFFKKFQNDSVFQVNHTKFPLKNTFLDSNGDYEVLREDLTKDKYRFIDFSKHKESETQIGGYKVNVKREQDTVYYNYRGIDNGILGSIKFTKVNGCWNLVAIEDSST